MNLEVTIKMSLKTKATLIVGVSVIAVLAGLNGAELMEVIQKLLSKG